MINYYLLTKPGIILGNLVTVAAGFLLASKGKMYPFLFLATLIGLAFIIASACVFNNYIDRDLDRKMKRTCQRPLAKGIISGKRALLFATFLGLIGSMVLYFYTNPLTLAVAGAGFFIYVVPYSLWKRHTIYGTAIGSIAGATPPVIGYCAVSHQLDLAAFLLFAMLILWQMPHFFAITIYRLRDYRAAHIPTLPAQKGLFRTKIHMILYILGFIFTSTLLTYFAYTGYLYLGMMLILSFMWLGLAVLGFERQNETAWGQQMFRWSLLVITAASILIPLDVVKTS